MNTGYLGRLMVTDNGAGFDLDSTSDEGEHFGLRVMRQRAASIMCPDVWLYRKSPTSRMAPGLKVMIFGAMPSVSVPKSCS